MKDKLQINTRVRRLIHYIEDIEKGLIQIPAFQRDFIWEKKDKLDLFDSIKRGYPIGSILFWKPSEAEFGESKKMGPYIIEEKKESYFYILDGFQRLSTLFGCLVNPNKTTLKYDIKELENDFSIYYDLQTEEFIVSRPNSKVEDFQIPLYIFLDTFEFLSYSQKLMNKPNFAVLVDRAKVLATSLVDFQLPSIDIVGGEISEAVEIFSRINSKGSTISPDWMISALTYNQNNDFRLGTLIDELIEELKEFNFGEIKRELIFQCISNSFGKAHFDQSGKVELLAKRKDFIPKTMETINSIKKAVQFLFEELLVLDVKLLPYGNQLIFITDFYNSIENPSEYQIDILKEWFWITTYSNYFTIYSLSKQREAYNKFQKFIKGEVNNPLYIDNPNVKFSVIDFPSKIYSRSVRSNALVLFLLNFSNEFEKLDFKNFDSFYLSYLFNDFKDIKGNYYPESLLTIINKKNDINYPKNKDMSFLLQSYNNLYQNHFITEIMSDLYDFVMNRKFDVTYKIKKEDKEPYFLEILKLRKTLIIQEEKQFVESLGLIYENN